MESVVREGDPEVFRRFYKKWYRPERMAVVVAGGAGAGGGAQHTRPLPALGIRV